MAADPEGWIFHRRGRRSRPSSDPITGEMCESRMQAKTMLEELENKRPRAEGAVHGKIAHGAARLSPAPLPRNDWLQDKHINLS
jgi:hypothetical protein